MHEQSFLAGLELGKYLTRLSTVEVRLGNLEKKVDERSGKARRGAILVVLWGAALAANIYPDKAAEMVVEIARSALRP